MDLGWRFEQAVTCRSSLVRTRLPLGACSRPKPCMPPTSYSLHAFRRAGGGLALLCLARGQASPLNSTCERPERFRSRELQYPRPEPKLPI